MVQMTHTNSPSSPVLSKMNLNYTEIDRKVNTVKNPTFDVPLNMFVRHENDSEKPSLEMVDGQICTVYKRAYYFLRLR